MVGEKFSLLNTENTFYNIIYNINYFFREENNKKTTIFFTDWL